jgi:hypothetical protein
VKELLKTRQKELGLKSKDINDRLGGQATLIKTVFI